MLMRLPSGSALRLGSGLDGFKFVSIRVHSRLVFALW
jgi:hypothetical protein